MDSMSLAQRMHFSWTYFKWPLLRWWRSWIRPVKLSIPLTNSFFQYGMNLLNDDHFEFSNGLWIVLIHCVLQENPKIKIWGFRSVECAYHWGLWLPLIRRIKVEPFHYVVSCVWKLSILLKPFHISIHSMTCSKCLLELFSTSMERSFVTMTVSSSVLSNQNCSIIPDFEMTSNAVHFREWKGIKSISSWGLCAQVHSHCYWHVHWVQIVLQPNNIKEVKM